MIGPATRIPFIAGSDFTDVFPLFIVGFALITFLNLIPLVMKCLRIQRYARGATRIDEDTDVTMQEGQLLINKEKRVRGGTGTGSVTTDGKRSTATTSTLGRAGAGIVINPNARTLNGKPVIPASVRLAAANAAKAPPAPPRYTSSLTPASAYASVSVSAAAPTLHRARSTPSPTASTSAQRSRSASPSPSPSPSPPPPPPPRSRPR